MKRAVKSGDVQGEIMVQPYEKKGKKLYVLCFILVFVQFSSRSRASAGGRWKRGGGGVLAALQLKHLAIPIRLDSSAQLLCFFLDTFRMFRPRSGDI